MIGLPNTTYVPTKTRFAGLANQRVMVPLGLSDNVVDESEFAATGDWVANAGWAIAGGKATHTPNGTAVLSQADLTTLGDYYVVLYQVLDRTAGTVTVKLGTGAGPARDADGFYADVIQAAVGTSISFTPTGTFDGAIDNVYLYPLNENTGDPNTRNVIERIDWSYSAAPTGGGLQIADSTGVIFDIDIAAAEPDQIEFVDEDGDLTGGFYGTARKPLVIILKPGAGAVTGALNVTSR